ncbi:MAG: DUF4011 domain-containing protein [Alphaproteobacteria bacterium]
MSTEPPDPVPLLPSLPSEPIARAPSEITASLSKQAISDRTPGDQISSDQILGKPILEISLTPKINAAFYHNAIPILNEVKIVNPHTHDLIDINIAISCPELIREKTWHIAKIAPGSDYSLRDLDVPLNGRFLDTLEETRRVEITFTCYVNGHEIAKDYRHLQVLSHHEWCGIQGFPEIIAAYVKPNDGAVDKILHHAAQILRDSGKPGIDGYQSGARSRVWEIAAAIWAALGSLKIEYSNPPASFEQTGQKIRSPSMLCHVETRIGTCLDLALLYAACLEQAGLNPLIIFKRGHAFTGLWLAKENFTIAAIDDPQSLRKRIQLQEMILVEATLLTHQPLPLFRHATEQGAAHIALSEDQNFEVAIDINRARLRRIFPLADGIKTTPLSPESDPTTSAPIRIEEAPFLPQDIVTPAVTEEDDHPLGRLEKWKRHLLDLSLRNKLLNFKVSEKSITFDCPNPGRIEDLLASGVELKILPHAQLMDGVQDPRSARLHLERNKEDILRKHAEDALDRRELYVKLEKSKLDQQLIALLRTVRTAMQEGGANTLYLAIGFLTWQDHDTPFQKTGTPRRYKAPLILIPVSLVRKNIKSDFYLVLHEDEPRLNPTLLQMLRQDFGISIPSLDGELPKDESGLDVDRIWKTVAEAVKNTQGWEVTEEVILSTFSFTKYLMWKDLVERGDALKNSLLVRHLLDSSESAFGNGEEFPDVRNLDQHINPAELFCPLPADSTQLAAVIASTKGKSFVLIGPPGTGKSQTITNIIAHALGTGRSVLFVSEKMAALNVVYRRLKDLGLHDFCLELHSSQARKPDVLKQLQNSSMAREAFSVDEWQRQASHLKALRDRLNGYATALHQKHSNGLTVHLALSRVITATNTVPFVPLQWAHKDVHNEDGLDQLYAATERLATNLDTLGDIQQHPFAAIKRNEWSPKWQAELIATCRQVIGAVSKLQKSRGEVSTAMGLDLKPTTEHDFKAWAKLLLALTSLNQQPVSFGFTADAHHTIQEITEALTLVDHIQKIRQRLTGRYAKTATRLPLTQLNRDWGIALKTWWPRSMITRRRVKKALAVVLEGEASRDYGFDLKVLRKIRELEKRLASHGNHLKKILGTLWADDETDINDVQEALMWIAQIKSLAREAIDISNLQNFYDVLSTLLGDDPQQVALASPLGQKFHRFAQDLDQLLQLITTLGTLASEKLTVTPTEDWLTGLQGTCAAWLAHIPKLNAWCGWQAARQNAEALGLSELVGAVERGEVSPKNLSETFMVNYCRWWLDHAVDGDADLRSFVSAEHEKRILDFQAADQRLTDLTRKIIRARLCGTLPSSEEKFNNTQWKLLSHEFAKKKMHKPVRHLMTAAPDMIARLAPCMMMSPLSVAQYLPSKAKLFDLVIFDEASQIPVWDAVGAIARGKQAIIVGDNKQLPPTSFFSRSSDDIYDEEIGEPEDLESILDQCLSVGIPQLSLRWHYRSQHESLIAFSNRYYYGGELVTFPSPVTTDSAVSYVHVPDGVYEKGGARTNQVEAKAVVKAATDILLANPSSHKPTTLGIVTFNSEQQKLIEDLIDNERRHHPEIEPYFSEDLPEPVFVKNLENVQGDERDIILFSIGYGPDQNGRVSMNFGPLNRAGGERRLNVAVTRARKALKIFTALHPDQLDLSRTHAQGVRDLKHFMDFASRGKSALLEATTFTGRAMDSPFEEAVAAELGRRGWHFHPQVGVSGFRVDLGIVHPDKPGRYLAGIECDGATYHRAATARDRDRLREQILTGLGWKIIRVWSTDWWVDKETAANKIHERLTLLYQQEHAAAAAAEARETSGLTPQ